MTLVIDVHFLFKALWFAPLALFCPHYWRGLKVKLPYTFKKGAENETSQMLGGKWG